MTDTLARLSVLATHNATSTDNFITVLELAHMAQQPRIGAKATAPLVTPYQSASKTAGAAQAAMYAAVVIDHDSDNKTEVDIRHLYGADGLNVRYLAFTTSSHTPEAQRWKVVVPFALPVDADTAAELSAGIAYSLASDPAQARKQQGFYAPNKLTLDAAYTAITDTLGEPWQWLYPDNGESVFIREAVQGWDEYQAELGRITSQAKAKPKPAHAAMSASAGIVGLIQASHDLAELLERYDYRHKGRGLYLSPYSSSGIAGVKLLESSGKQVVYSHHGPACPLSTENHEGHALDVADVLCALQYSGDYSAMIRDQAQQLDTDGQKQRQREYMRQQDSESVKFTDNTDWDAMPGADDAAPAVPQQLINIDLSDVMQAHLENVGFCVKPWFPNRHVTLFGGHGGIGKSTLALAVAAHVAAGLPFAGMEVTQSTVLFVSLEDEPMIVRLRLRRVIEAYGLSTEKVLENMRLLDGTQGMAALMTGGDGFNSEPQFTLVYRDLLKQSEGAGLVIIDNASDAFEANENARRDVRLFMRGLVRIAREYDAAVVLLAHIDKMSAKAGSQGNSYSGSTAWHNSARSRIALINEEGGVSVLHEKANLSACADPLPININEHGIPMPARLEGTQEAGGMTTEAMDQAEMLRAMRAAAEAGINVPANVTPGAHSAMNALANLPEYSPTFKRGRQGKSRASSALTAMCQWPLILTHFWPIELTHLLTANRRFSASSGSSPLPA